MSVGPSANSPSFKDVQQFQLQHKDTIEKGLESTSRALPAGAASLQAQAEIARERDGLANDQLVSSQAIQAYAHSNGLATDKLDHLLSKYDARHDGSLTQDEFDRVMAESGGLTKAGAPAAAAAPAPAAPSAGEASPAAPPKALVVKPGDSLSRITRDQGLDPQRWHELYEANKAKIGNNPDLIRPGTRLDEPPAWAAKRAIDQATIAPEPPAGSPDHIDTQHQTDQTTLKGAQDAMGKIPADSPDHAAAQAKVDALQKAFEQKYPAAGGAAPAAGSPPAAAGGAPPNAAEQQIKALSAGPPPAAGSLVGKMGPFVEEGKLGEMKSALDTIQGQPAYAPLKTIVDGYEAALAAAKRPAPAAAPAAAPRAYALQAGDTLASIAQQQLGDAGLAQAIYDLNKGLFERLGTNGAIPPGTNLQLPAVKPPAPVSAARRGGPQAN